MVCILHTIHTILHIQVALSPSATDIDSNCMSGSIANCFLSLCGCSQDISLWYLICGMQYDIHCTIAHLFRLGESIVFYWTGLPWKQFCLDFMCCTLLCRGCGYTDVSLPTHPSISALLALCVGNALVVWIPCGPLVDPHSWASNAGH